MFKNPLKYQSGGVTQSKEQEAENQLISAIAEGLGAQPEQVKARLEQIKSNPDEVKELQSALQLMQQDQNAGFQAILKLFAGKPQSAKHGGKIQDFICKYARGGQVAGCGCKQEGCTFESKDKQVKIKDFGTAQADTIGNYSYPSTNGEFQFNPMGRTATVWDNTGVLPIHRYADQNWINRHPRKQMLPRFLGGHRELAPAGFFENLVERVNNRTPQVQENGGVVKNQEPAGPIPEPDDSYFGTISEDTTNPIRRWIDNKINNNPTLYRTRQGLRNFEQSAPGKVLDFFVPDVTSENGFMSAIVPVGKIGKLGKGSLRRRNYDPFVWEVVAKDPVVLENAKKLGLQEGSSEWADFIEKTAKELYDLARLKNGGKVEKAQWSGNAQRLVPPIYDVKNK